MSLSVRFEQICFDLSREGFDLAFVEAGDEIFFSRFPSGVEAPSSAVMKLLQGVYDRRGRESFRVLRNRIFSSVSLTEKCRGMVRVAGKRAFEGILPVDHGLSLVASSFHEIGRSEDVLSFQSFDSVTFEPRLVGDDLASDVDPPGILRRLEGLRLRQDLAGQRHESDRRILAVLLGPEGQLLGQARNTNALNRTLHAEVNLIQDFYRRTGRKIPVGSRFFSTHKPCKMCAGLIHDWSEDPRRLQVFYRHEETGGMSRHTVLDRWDVQTRVD